MPAYSYSGINDKGKNVTGSMEAENEKVARAKLRKSGIFPTSLALGGSIRSAKMGLSAQYDFKKLFSGIKKQEVSLMTRQMSTLLAAHVPLVDALQAMSEQISNEKLKNIVSEMRQKVVEGAKWSDTMKAYPKVFNGMYINMVNAGENSGALDIVLSRLADFTENQDKIRSKVTGAMIYPIIMGVVGVGLMTVLLTFMVPKMTAIFKGQKMVLPLPTRILIFISGTLSDYWYIILILLGVGIYFLMKWIKRPAGREYKDGLLLRMPVFGNLVRLVAISRFARTLSTLLSSGVPMLMAMDIVKNVVGNVVLLKAVEDTRDSVKEGESIAEPLKRSGHFPPLVTHMISIGEKTGSLEGMLERISDTYDAQVDNAVSTMLSLLEPILIMVMGGAITFVVISILLPILQMGDLGSLGR
ncbi:MAG: type II secretion system protein GspF [Deltaproteobacteria bacterium CG11_big_fil_rev_8_21_14_0_20_49_13]|nr:MAG: type II secretion system protein GspF [Deltaproteobacteria bacterium CG11_big_fil_rev_8_21_14_0_20_49_13]